MTGVEALDHYAKALACAARAKGCLEDAPGYQSKGTGGSACDHRLKCAETALKEALGHVKALRQLDKGKRP